MGPDEALDCARLSGAGVGLGAAFAEGDGPQGAGRGDEEGVAVAGQAVDAAGLDAGLALEGDAVLGAEEAFGRGDTQHAIDGEQVVDHARAGGGVGEGLAVVGKAEPFVEGSEPQAVSVTQHGSEVVGAGLVVRGEVARSLAADPQARAGGAFEALSLGLGDGGDAVSAASWSDRGFDGGRANGGFAVEGVALELAEAGAGAHAN